MRAESLRQRHARIDSARAPGWDSARRSGDRREQPSHYDKYDRIRDRNSKELTLESALQAKDTDGTDAQTQTYDDYALVHHKSEHCAGTRAEGESDAYLLPALCDEIRNHADHDEGLRRRCHSKEVVRVVGTVQTSVDGADPGPESRGERLIHDDDVRCGVHVAVVEQSAGDQPRMHRLQVPGRRDDSRRRDDRFAGAHLVALRQ